jgi:hypothetical protein
MPRSPQKMDTHMLLVRNNEIWGKATMRAVNNSMVKQNGNTPKKIVPIVIFLSFTMEATTNKFIPTGGEMLESSI